MAVDLTIDPNSVCVMVLKARQINVKEQADVDEDDASNAIDDGMRGVLADTDDDATREELTAMIEGLSEGEAAELIAIVWIGRGDFEAEEFPDAVREALGRAETDEPEPARYLLGMPLLGDYLAEGIAALGRPCAEEAIAIGAGTNPV